MIEECTQKTMSKIAQYMSILATYLLAYQSQLAAKVSFLMGVCMRTIA